MKVVFLDLGNHLLRVIFIQSNNILVINVHSQTKLEERGL